MTDPRAIYFRPEHRKDIGRIMVGLLPVSEIDIYKVALQLANEEISKTMPRWVDNLECYYTPNALYLAPFIAKIYDRYGITSSIATSGDHNEYAILTAYFTHLPEISHTYILRQGSITIGRVSLYNKLTHKYFTPYVEEAYTLELLPKILPQPIAEEITSCMMGVIARRCVTTHKYVAEWQDAWEQEVEFTYTDMFGRPPPKTMLVPAADSWESAAIKMHNEAMW